MHYIMYLPLLRTESFFFEWFGFSGGLGLLLLIFFVSSITCLRCDERVTLLFFDKHFLNYYITVLMKIYFMI